MFISNWFKRRAAAPAVSEFVEESAQELTTVRRSLKRREKRIAFLRKRLRNERLVHATELSAKDEMLNLQQKRHVTETSTDSQDAERLRHDLKTALTLLDEFEAEARDNWDVTVRSAQIEAENKAQRHIIAELEDEVMAWRGSRVVAA